MSQSNLIEQWTDERESESSTSVENVNESRNQQNENKDENVHDCENCRIGKEINDGGR